MGNPADNLAIQLRPALAVWENEGGAPAHTDGDAAINDGGRLKGDRIARGDAFKDEEGLE